jgi:hypothetical protein
MARDLAPHVNKVYMVGKNVLSGPESYQAMRRSQRLMMPDNAQLVPEIQEFRTPKGSMEASEIVLTDGTVLSNIGLIIFSTG